MGDFLYKDESYAVRGARLDVYKEIGHGFLKAVHQECLMRELEARGIPFEAQSPFTFYYKGNPLNPSYIPDFICYGKMVLETKAVKELADEHRAQLLNYIKATGLELGFLINFEHHPGIQMERIALSKQPSAKLAVIHDQLSAYSAV